MRLKVLLLVKVGLETPRAVTFRGLGGLQVLEVDWETGLEPGDSLQEQSPLVAHTRVFRVCPWLAGAPMPGVLA